MKSFLLFFGLYLISTASYAGNTNPGGLEPVPEPPELPDPLETGENIEPQVTIIHKDDATIEEYRVGGTLYMVKITPVVGPSYYLIDNDGDGQLETRRRELDGPVIPQWILLTW